MKKIILITSLFVLFAGLNGLFAQQIQINPIPRFNYQLTALNTGFQEAIKYTGTNREKRDMDVVISSSSVSVIPVFATVWVVKNNVIFNGPYTIFMNEPLIVPIDNSGRWGVIIRCDWSVLASVWID
ncbi:MAG: hypothetical protein Q8M08_09580 [Bacteroidales bacterium]|nr:hypothetical protein [Bacteroidales bacterium]